MLALRQGAKDFVEETECCLGLTIHVPQDSAIVNQQPDVLTLTSRVSLDMKKICRGVPLTKPKQPGLLPGYHSLQ
jgi:hypothetical protein